MGFDGEWRSVQSFTAAGFQNMSRLGLPSRSAAFGIAGFFFEGETSLLGLGGARGGVDGREMGGALQGERCLVGVGEYVRIANPPSNSELVGRDDAKELDRTLVGGGRADDAGTSGESVRSITSCAHFDIVL